LLEFLSKKIFYHNILFLEKRAKSQDKRIKNKDKRAKTKDKRHEFPFRG
jgi:hypothetical protein